jgi:hypothetical protein
MPALSFTYGMAMDSLPRRSIERRSDGPPLAVKVAVPILSVLALAIIGLLIYKALRSDRYRKSESQRVVVPGATAKKVSDEAEEELPAHPGQTTGQRV